jgi:hypothetical protein
LKYSGRPGTSRSGIEAVEQAKLPGAIVASCFLSPSVCPLGCSRLVMRLWHHRNHCNIDGLGLWLVPIYTVRGERVRVNWSQNPNKLDDSYDVQFGAFSNKEDHDVLDFHASLMSLLPQDDVIWGKKIIKRKKETWAWFQIIRLAEQERSWDHACRGSLFNFLFFLFIISLFYVFIFQFQFQCSNPKLYLSEDFRI